MLQYDIRKQPRVARGYHSCCALPVHHNTFFPYYVEYRGLYLVFQALIFLYKYCLKRDFSVALHKKGKAGQQSYYKLHTVALSLYVAFLQASRQTSLQSEFQTKRNNVDSDESLT